MDEIFTADCSICVLVAGPGSGKSSLLRMHLTRSAGRWLAKQSDASVPVMIRAAALTGTAPLPTVLANATNAELAMFGLQDELTPTSSVASHAPKYRGW
ncbi:ATP-binding protein [Streptomyces sp. NRRL B-24484]|uniref:ATP-binding protein n=1 Tax=Streptomyces sp. NRRL B-24484 TaxID=1463833 RepID=UPI0004BE8C31|nr:ATP-binding protein [Streptomyces sp. NRRL B-24484]